MATKKRARPARRKSHRRYGKRASRKVRKAVHEWKRGKLKAGKGRHPKAKSRKQAIAIGLSEARKEGAKVPPPPKKRGRKRRKRRSS
jgi:hypothetical protein